MGRGGVIGQFGVGEEAEIHVCCEDGDIEALVGGEILVVLRERDDRRGHLGLCGDETLTSQ